MENKKVRNTKKHIYNGIKFKSGLEVNVYKTLIKAGFFPDYEKLKFNLWEGFKPKIAFYNRNKKGEFVKETTKLINITYTPDFTFKYKNMLIIVEAKGKENDTFPIKKKLFRGLLETLDMPCIYFEVRSIKETEQAISIIKNYETTIR